MSASSREVLERALAQIEADAALNAWSYLDAAAARRAAGDSDARLTAGDARSPLEGRPIAIKANIAVQGWPQDAGLLSRRGLTAVHDAPVIARLRAAGAVLLGQTRMDSGALGAEGRSIDGPIHNPRRAGHSAGGSSGGSAAALAAGHVGLALGTDTIGSVRIPAAFCGIASLKPSAGCISLEGVVPLHADYDHVGPMTASAADLQKLWTVLAGQSTPPPPAGSDMADLPIGYLADAEALGATPAVLDHYANGLAILRDMGARLQPLQLAPLEPGRTRKAIFALCEHMMWLAHRDSLEQHPEWYPPSLTGMLQFGAALDASRLDGFRERIGRFAMALRAMLQPLRALVTPTTPAQAFAFDGPTPLDLADLTAIATAAALPAATVPLPTGSDLPVGLQIITHPGEDLLACRLAAGFEQVLSER